MARGVVTRLVIALFVLRESPAAVAVSDDAKPESNGNQQLEAAKAALNSFEKDHTEAADKVEEYASALGSDNQDKKEKRVWDSTSNTDEGSGLSDRTVLLLGATGTLVALVAGVTGYSKYKKYRARRELEDNIIDYASSESSEMTNRSVSEPLHADGGSASFGIIGQNLGQSSA